MAIAFLEEPLWIPIQSTMTSPPLNNVMYHVTVNGQATGPFDMNILSQIVIQGTLAKDTLVWKQGMQNWNKVGSFEELSNLFFNSDRIGLKFVKQCH